MTPRCPTTATSPTTGFGKWPTTTRPCCVKSWWKIPASSTPSGPDVPLAISPPVILSLPGRFPHQNRPHLGALPRHIPRTDHHTLPFREPAQHLKLIPVIPPNLHRLKMNHIIVTHNRDMRAIPPHHQRIRPNQQRRLHPRRREIHFRIHSRQQKPAFI